VPPAIGPPVRVLFVCLGNACRSQMAEALARKMAPDVILPASAGMMALGEIPEQTRQVLAARGVEMDGQYSKPLRSEIKEWADVIVNMTGVPGTSAFSDLPHKVEDWDVSDPFGKDAGLYEITCDEIESRVGDLARRLRQMRAAKKKA
jgi:arsenate reductase